MGDKTKTVEVYTSVAAKNLERKLERAWSGDLESVTMSWTSVIFEAASGQTAGKILLEAPRPMEDGSFVAQVTFAGLDLPVRPGKGSTEIEALIDALRRGSETLDTFRSMGGRVLRDISGYGLLPLDEPLEQTFRFGLETQYGLPKEPIDAIIIDGPTPDASGQVLFKVKVGQRVIVGVATPGAFGCLDSADDLQAGNAAMRAVDRFTHAHEGEELGWFREAARLRREAGRSSPFVRRPGVIVVGAPRRQGASVLFRTEGAAIEIRVIVSPGGVVMDDCDDWMRVTDEDRSAATGAVLDHIFANRDLAAALGIDVNLLEELWT